MTFELLFPSSPKGAPKMGKPDLKSIATNLPKLYLAQFLVGFHLFSAVLVPFFVEWGKISFSQILFLQSWFMFWVFALEVPTGAVADKFGRKVSFSLGLFVYAIATVIYASFPSFWVFLFGEFLMALGNALISGADGALLYDTLKSLGREDEAKKHIGRVESAHLSGILIGAIVGGFVASAFGMNYPMLFTSIPRILGAILVISCVEPVVSGKAKKDKGYWKILFSGVRIFAKSKVLKILAFDAVSISAISYYVLWFYQPILSKFAFPIAYFGLVHAAIVIGEIVVSYSFPALEKLSGGKKNYLVFSAVATGISLIGLALAQSPGAAIFFSIAAGSFGLTRYALMTAYMNGKIRSSERATVLSSISMVQKMGIALGNVFVGLISGIVPKEIVLGALGILALASSAFSGVEEKHLDSR